MLADLFYDLKSTEVWTHTFVSATLVSPAVCALTGEPVLEFEGMTR